MRHLAMTAAAVTAAVTLAACGGSSGPAPAPSTAGSMPMMTTAPTSAGDHNQADVTFAQMMIPHHQQAIEMAALAPDRASSADVKALAARIQAAQQPEIDQMKGWLDSWGIPATSGGTGHAMSTVSGATEQNMSGGRMGRDDTAKLEGLSGVEFDREFLTSMTAHHRGAIDMAETEQANGSYGPARTMAADIISAQTKEITTMSELLKSIQ